MIFGHAVIAWIFFLIFYYCKILNFGLLKVRFRRKKQKDVKDDGRFGMQLSFEKKGHFVYLSFLSFRQLCCNSHFYVKGNKERLCSKVDKLV